MDTVAAGVDPFALLRGDIGAEDLGELGPNLPHEVRGLPIDPELGREYDRLALRLFVLVDGVLGARQRAAGLHLVEHVVAPDDDLGGVGNHLLDLRGRALGAFLDRDRATVLGVLDEIELRRRLRDRGQQRGLGEGQALEVLVEVGLRSRLDPVRLVAVEVLVQIGGDDLLLALLAGIGLGQTQGLDDLADLALLAAAVEGARGQESGPDQLLGDRRAAAGMAAQRVGRRGDEAGGIEARVGPEVLVLDRGGRVEHLGRDVGERDDLALELAEARQLDLVGSVEDDGLLIERQVAQGVARVGQALAVVAVGGGNADHPRQADREEGREEQDRDRDGDSPDGGRAAGPLAAEAAPMALPPREAGLHDGPHDSIGAVSRPSCLPLVTARATGL